MPPWSLWRKPISSECERGLKQKNLLCHQQGVSVQRGTLPVMQETQVLPWLIWAVCQESGQTLCACEECAIISLFTFDVLCVLLDMPDASTCQAVGLRRTLSKEQGSKLGWRSCST